MADRLVDLDYQKLDQHVENVGKIMRLADVKDQVERVAFDVVRFKDEEDFSKLWVIKPSDNGDVIIAMYDDDGLESKSNWQAIPDRTAAINVFYKGEPVKKISLVSLGVPSEDAFVVSRALVKGLNEDITMRTAFLKDIPVVERRTLLQKYPELTK